METWRFLVSLCILLIVWTTVVTLLGQPPGPRGVIVATVMAAGALYVSDRLSRRMAEK